MDRFKNLLTRKPSASNDVNGSGDSPEADVARGVRLFCESGGPNNTGEEVLHLPVIVDASESSPAAAKEAAYVIRKFLSKSNFMRAYVQYNAIMLVRILADNPGPTFTRNIDAKFVATVKELLRDGRDMSVQQILRETLDTFELQKSNDETLTPLVSMWKSEKAKWAKRSGNDISSGIMQNARTYSAPPFAPGQQPHFPPGVAAGYGNGPLIPGSLPPPHELASRIEEARTSSKLLTQVVQSTPPAEVLRNDLIKEFAERCQAASRSVQGYINADNPAPDEETLLTLIETNDAIAAALSKHQRALLQARKISTASPPPNADVQTRQERHRSRQNQPTTATPATTILADTSVPDNPVAKAGPPPRLGMPKPPERLENPFDDKHDTEGEANTNGGPSRSGETSAADLTLSPGQAAYANASGRMDRERGRPQDDEDSDEESARPMVYRF